jgi:hypothetical protein
VKRERREERKNILILTVILKFQTTFSQMTDSAIYLIFHLSLQTDNGQCDINISQQNVNSHRRGLRFIDEAN